MRRRNRIHQVSMGSMADIAFLLLIFFLMATTIESDVGILRKLPQIADIPNPVQVNDRNILVVLVNRDNKLMVEGKERELANLKEVTIEFITNRKNEENLPELFYETIDYIGRVRITKNHVISLQSDRGTSYEMYIAVQNELQKAYNELRDIVAHKQWDTAFNKLSQPEREAIIKMYPMKISEAEPNF